MEKLLKIVTLSIALLISLKTVAQQNFIVFKTKGMPLVKYDNGVKPLYKGDAISKLMTVILNDNDTLYYINNAGQLFIVKSSGKYEYEDLINYKQDNTTNVTADYFKYVWQSFINELKDTDGGGAVYRSKKESFGIPNDKSKIITNTINFKWKKESKSNQDYLVLIEEKTNRTLKIGVNNKVSLFVDDYILKHNSSYKWAITNKVDIPVNLLNFQKFTVPSIKEIEDYLIFTKNLTEDLQTLGFEQEFIKKQLQEFYNLYY